MLKLSRGQRRIVALLPALLAALYFALLLPGGDTVALWKGAAVLSGCCALTLLLWKKRAPETVFTVLMVCFGLFYIFAITPLSAPDEAAHLRAVLTLSSRLLRGDTVCDAAYLSTAGFTGHENTAEAFTALTQGLFTETLTGTMADFPAFEFTYPVMYFPQTVGAVLAQLLGLNRLWLFVLGDLTNWLFYTAVIALAIRLIPRGKLPMAFSALLPMSLQLCTSMSPDAFVTAMAYLFIALVVRAMERETPARPGELICILLTGMLLSPAKAVYFLLLPLVALIPGRRFGSGKRRAAFCAAVLAVAVVFTVLFQLPSFLRSAPAQADSENAFYSVSWVLTHIPQTAVMFIKTLIPSGIFDLIESTLGTQLSGFTLQMVNGYLYAMLFMLLLLALCGQDRDRPLRPAERGGFLLSSLLVLLAVMGTMLLNWTEVGEILIQGVQGRYLIPVLPLLWLSMQNRAFHCDRDLAQPLTLGFTLAEWLCVNHILGHLA